MKALSHVYVANAVINDVRKNNGKVKIGDLGLFNVRPEFVTPLMNDNYAPFIRAGAIGPDAFPSLLSGQTQAHPYIDKWLAYMDNQMHVQNPSSNDIGKNAFYIGYLSHICADIWTHDWVIQYSGGPWPETAKMGSQESIKNVAIHLAIETILDNNVAMIKGNMPVNIAVPTQALVELIINTAKIPINSTNGILRDNDISCDAFLEKGFVKNYWYTQQFLGSAGSLNAITTYLIAWHGDLNKGLYEWVTAHEKAVSRHLSGGEDFFGALKDEWLQWAKKNLLSMYGTPDLLAKLPVFISNLLDINLDFFKELQQKVQNEIQDYICKIAFGMTFNELKEKINPNNLLSLLNDKVKHEKIISECQNIPLFTEINETHNPIFWNSVVFSKIALLPLSEQERLAKLCGISLPEGTYPLPFGAMSIDGSGQFKYGAMDVLTKNLFNKKIITHFEQPEAIFSRLPLPHEERKLCMVDSLLKSVSVQLHTTNKKYAGSDANIYFGVIFNDNTRAEWLLDLNGAEYNDFETGDTNWYHLFNNMPNRKKEDIGQIFIRMDNYDNWSGDDWHCSAIVVSINGDSLQSFTVNKEFTHNGDMWVIPFRTAPRLIVESVRPNLPQFSSPSISLSDLWKFFKF